MKAVVFVLMAMVFFSIGSADATGEVRGFSEQGILEFGSAISLSDTGQFILCDSSKGPNERTWVGICHVSESGSILYPIGYFADTTRFSKEDQPCSARDFNLLQGKEVKIECKRKRVDYYYIIEEIDICPLE